MRLRHLSAVLTLAALAACSEPDPFRPPPSGEPNDTIAQATPIATGAPLPAVIGSYVDADYYGFTVPAGGAFVRVQTFDASGVTCDAVDTYTELFSAAGTLLAWDDDGGPNLCEDFVRWVSEGTYFVAVSHGGGAAEAFAYALLVTVTPGGGATGAEIEPNGSIAAANGPYLADAVVSGTISTTSDYDYFALTNDSPSPRIVYLETFEGAVGSCIFGGEDSTLYLYTASGTLLAWDDDSGINNCSYMSYSIPAYTTYYVRVAGYVGDTFSYLLEIDFL